MRTSSPSTSCSAGERTRLWSPEGTSVDPIVGYRFASFQAVDKSGESYVFTFSAYGLQATAYWMKSTETRGEAYAEIVDLDDYDLKAARQARHRAAREQGALREAAAHATGLDETAVRHLMMDLVSIDDRVLTSAFKEEEYGIMSRGSETDDG